MQWLVFVLHAVSTSTGVKLELDEKKAHLFRHGSVVDGHGKVFLTRVQNRPLRPAGRLVSKHATKQKQQQTEVFRTAQRGGKQVTYCSEQRAVEGTILYLGYVWYLGAPCAANEAPEGGNMNILHISTRQLRRHNHTQQGKTKTCERYVA